jgi:hypothetical protein
LGVELYQQLSTCSILGSCAFSLFVFGKPPQPDLSSPANFHSLAKAPMSTPPKHAKTCFKIRIRSHYDPFLISPILPHPLTIDVFQGESPVTSITNTSIQQLRSARLSFFLDPNDVIHHIRAAWRSGVHSCTFSLLCPSRRSESPRPVQPFLAPHSRDCLVCTVYQESSCPPGISCNSSVR